MSDIAPHVRLETVFAAVLDQARRDPEFARRLWQAIEQGLADGAESAVGGPRDALPGKPVIAKARSSPPERPRGGKKTKAASGAPRAEAAACAQKTSAADKKRHLQRHLPKALSDLDLAALIADRGRRGAQTALLDSRYTAPELRDFAKQCGASLRGRGRRRRDLIDALIATAPHSRADAFA